VPLDFDLGNLDRTPTPGWHLVEDNVLGEYPIGLPF